MSLLYNWDKVKDYLCSLADVASDAKDFYEAVIEKHLNSKLFLHYALCSNKFYFFVQGLKSHFLVADNPNINTSCPECGKALNQYLMNYHSIVS